jgi:hypothetical protein
MNDLIKEFAKEHLLHEKYDAYGDIIEGDYYEFDPEELQKFAELIILECDKFVSTNFHDSGMTLGYKIKKHFGVNDESC